ncbi:UNVERIFIED_CONTAM: hypothetical protein GTU68_009206 [Idotea baltica]|nr:hypothetical protein [Idotea baltica]
MNHWQKNGLPNSPAAWLITTARRKAIDRLRKDQNFASKQRDVSYLLDLANQSTDAEEAEVIPDKRLEMIFICCHPALEEKTQVALTLRLIGGLSTDEIAHAFLDRPDAMQQRLTRAKKKIAFAGIPFGIPDRDVLPERISSVLRIVYLIFNEGYSASSGDTLTRVELSDEAVRLARIACQLLPEETELAGLLSLMLIHDSRRHARIGKDGEMIPLEKQNRARWDKAKIAEGHAILENTLPKGRVGPFQLQAAISSVHAHSASWSSTDWSQIAALYDVLYSLQPSSVIRINQAVAVSYAHSLPSAIKMLDECASDGELDLYQPYFAAKADVLARLGKLSEAKTCFETAIHLSENKQEKIFLKNKMMELG